MLHRLHNNRAQLDLSVCCKAYYALLVNEVCMSNACQKKVVTSFVTVVHNIYTYNVSEHETAGVHTCGYNMQIACDN